MVTKNDLTIIPKPHAYPHTMKKRHAKFKMISTCKRSFAHKTTRVNVENGWMDD